MALKKKSATNKKIEVLCEQTRELTDDLYDFFGLCLMLSGLGNLWSIVIFRVRAVVQCSLM